MTDDAQRVAAGIVAAWWKRDACDDASTQDGLIAAIADALRAARAEEREQCAVTALHVDMPSIPAVLERAAAAIRARADAPGGGDDGE